VKNYSQKLKFCNQEKKEKKEKKEKTKTKFEYRETIKTFVLGD